jgi:hypothetical protein
MQEHLNKRRSFMFNMSKSEDIDKIIRLIIYLVIIYLVLKFFKVL